MQLLWQKALGLDTPVYDTQQPSVLVEPQAFMQPEAQLQQPRLTDRPHAEAVTFTKIN